MVKTDDLTEQDRRSNETLSYKHRIEWKDLGTEGLGLTGLKLRAENAGLRADVI